MTCGTRQKTLAALVLLLVFIAGMGLCGPSTSQRSRVRRQNMKVRINATGDTIVMKFLRPNSDTKLEGYILGYGSSMFSKQFIQLPENGKPYETEFDAEPKYLIAVQPIPTNDVKKHCTGKVELDKPLHLVIGSVTPTSVLLSWGTLLKTPYEGNIMNDCLEDGHYTVRYRERNRKWNYQTCPTSDTVIDHLKPNTVYEFGVQPNSKDGTGVWSKPVLHVNAGVSPSRTKSRVPLAQNITTKTTLGKGELFRPVPPTHEKVPLAPKRSSSLPLPDTEAPLPVPLKKALTPTDTSLSSPQPRELFSNLEQPAPNHQQPSPYKPITRPKLLPHKTEENSKVMTQGTREPHSESGALPVHHTGKGIHVTSQTISQTTDPSPQQSPSHPVAQIPELPQAQPKSKPVTPGPKQHLLTSMHKTANERQNQTTTKHFSQSAGQPPKSPSPSKKQSKQQQKSSEPPKHSLQLHKTSQPRTKPPSKNQTTPLVVPKLQQKVSLKQAQTNPPLKNKTRIAETKSRRVLETPRPNSQLGPQTKAAPPKTHSTSKTQSQTKPSEVQHQQNYQPDDQAATTPQLQTHIDPSRTKPSLQFSLPMPKIQSKANQQTPGLEPESRTRQQTPGFDPASRTRQQTPRLDTESRTHQKTPGLDTESRTRQQTPGLEPESRTHQQTPRLDTESRTHQQTPGFDAKPKTHQQTPGLDTESRTRQQTPRLDTESRTRQQTPRLDTESRTRQQTPGLEPESRTRQQTPRLDTESRTRQQTPRLDTESRTRQQTPGLEAESRTRQQTPRLDTESRTHQQTPRLDIESRTQQQTPRLEPESRTRQQTPKLDTESRTRQQTPRLEPESKIHQQTPRLDTESRTRQQTPRLDTESRTHQQTPGLDTESRTQQQTPRLDTEPKTIQLTPRLDTEPRTRQQTPELDTEPKTIQQTPRLNVEPKVQQLSHVRPTTQPSVVQTLNTEAPPISPLASNYPPQPGIQIQLPTKSDPTKTLPSVPTAPSPAEEGKPLPQPALATETPASYHHGTGPSVVEDTHSSTSSAANPAGRNATLFRVPPDSTHNGVRSIPPSKTLTTSRSSNTLKAGGAQHRGIAHPKPVVWSKEQPALRPSVPVNKRPNLVGIPNKHDKPMDLKQGDKISILKPFPPVSRQQTTTPALNSLKMDMKKADKAANLKPRPPLPKWQSTNATPAVNSFSDIAFNATRFDKNENSSVFQSQPATKVDSMGNPRFIASHVVYKTDKKPNEPCSITSSLAYFPDEEGVDRNVTNPPSVPPSNLTVVTVEGCPSFVILDWEKSDNETREYEVVSTTKGPNGQEVSILTTNQTHTAVENLKPASSYEFKVTPKNELGTGPSSDAVSFSTESADPRVSENVSGKDAIWTQFPFKADSYSECNGKMYVKRTWYRKFVGIQLCNSLRYKIYLSDSLNGKFYNIGDQTGYGEDHCQFVDSFLDGRTGTQMFADQLPSRPGFYRARRQEPVHFGEIGAKTHVTYVGWYECGTPIPGKW
ncbi:uncharacterized protein abi3bpa [Neosynchiropus ocellatus]